MKKLWLALWLVLATPAFAQAPLVFPAPSSPQLTPLSYGTSGTTGALTVTLSAYAARYTYLCGFVATSVGTTPAVVAGITVTGVPQTMDFQYNYVSSGQGILGVAFPGCITAATSNAAITITMPGSGGSGTDAALSAWGYAN